MRQQQITNLLLFLILLVLMANFIVKISPAASAIAETFSLDNCITFKMNEKPGGYVHVVTHEAPVSVQDVSFR